MCQQRLGYNATTRCDCDWMDLAIEHILCVWQNFISYLAWVASCIRVASVPTLICYSLCHTSGGFPCHYRLFSFSSDANVVADFKIVKATTIVVFLVLGLKG